MTDEVDLSVLMSRLHRSRASVAHAANDDTLAIHARLLLDVALRVDNALALDLLDEAIGVVDPLHRRDPDDDNLCHILCGTLARRADLTEDPILRRALYRWCLDHLRTLAGRDTLGPDTTLTLATVLGRVAELTAADDLPAALELMDEALAIDLGQLDRDLEVDEMASVGTHLGWIVRWPLPTDDTTATPRRARALNACRLLAERFADSPAHQLNLQTALIRTAEASAATDPDRSTTLLRQAISVAERLPGSRQLRRTAASALLRLSRLAGGGDASLAWDRQRIDLLRVLVAGGRAEDDRRHLASALVETARTLAPVDPDGAHAAWDEADQLLTALARRSDRHPGEEAALHEARQALGVG